MAGEELFAGFTAHNEYRKIVSKAAGDTYMRLTGNRSYYMHGHRPYAYADMANWWFMKDEITLSLQYYLYGTGWQQSASTFLSDGASGGVYAQTAHAFYERWRLYLNGASYNDGTQDFDELHMRTYDATYLQKNLGLSCEGKYVMKLNTSTRYTDTDPQYVQTKIYVNDFLMARNSLSAWN